jgi:hypothetical protein
MLAGTRLPRVGELLAGYRESRRLSETRQIPSSAIFARFAFA